MTRLRVTRHNILGLIIENINNNNWPPPPTTSIVQAIWSVCCAEEMKCLLWVREWSINIWEQYLTSDDDGDGNMVTSSELLTGYVFIINGSNLSDDIFSRSRADIYTHSIHSNNMCPAWLRLHIKRIWSLVFGVMTESFIHCQMFSFEFLSRQIFFWET